jgi:CrcB protein
MRGVRIDVRELGAIFAGGCVGALARAGLGQGIDARPGHWPWSTFIVNVVGAFLLGAFATRLPPSSYRRSLLGTGFCGALTTFATMQVELLHMLDDHRAGLALGYAAASLVCGYGALLAATRLLRQTREPA